MPRRSLGDYASTELALIGAKCKDIQALAKPIIKTLSDDYSIGYVDADHASFDNPKKGDYIEEGARVYWSDKNETQALSFIKNTNQFERHIQFNDCDLVLVNGNHFKAEFQILFLDTSKRQSIEKRVERLTNVIAIVEVDSSDIPNHVQDVVPNVDQIPRFNYEDPEPIIAFINAWLEARRPALNALILAGGKSTRMGQSKATMVYQDTVQLERLGALLESKVDRVYVSCRKEQELQTEYPKLYDRAENMGPLGAITTAFRSYPDQAWLVVACDLPLLDSDTIDHLIENRSSKHVATAFLNKDTGFAEPLITIWEPKSYMRMLQFEALGYSCPRKVLINSNTYLIEPIDSQKLMNVNTPEDFQRAINVLQ